MVVNYRGGTAVHGVAARTEPWSLDERILIHLALRLDLVPNLEGIVDHGIDLDSDEDDPNCANIRITRAKIREVRGFEYQLHIRRNGPMSHNS